MIHAINPFDRLFFHKIQRSKKMANREFYDVIIIGGGPAGLSAGIYALRASMRTVLIEKASPGGQVTLSDEIENYPGFQNINGFDVLNGTPFSSMVPSG
jgi:alkyl hydroperoxide reductase subunit AhpF